ncbi:hypothetical protein [Flavobacterium maritimum]|uniref:hypothetical protein n=1 Tax=Flavobacterium maritimum TaxID=3149042 RepID=UPI0032B4F3CC
MEKQYSLAIYPPEAVIVLIKSMKEQLATKVGWFHSKNSVGHITICEFKATDAKKANHLFTKIELHFVCDSVVLRLFDENIKQFFVTDTFKFKGNPQPELIQGTLF